VAVEIVKQSEVNMPELLHITYITRLVYKFLFLVTGYVTSERDGAVIFNCADIETVGWLKSLTTVLTMKEAVGIDELPKRHRVVVHVEDPKLSVKQIIDLLDRQNEGLTSGEWIVVRGSESRDATSAHFAALIGDQSLEGLKAFNFKPYCGLGQASIKLPAKARRENKDVKGSTEPTK
jgi:hypothetical protein